MMIGIERRNMKGFIFTVDAVFALIVAMAAISILLFANYAPTFSTQSSTSEAYSVMQNLLGTTLGQYAQASPLAAYAASSYTQQQCTWPQYGDDAALDSSTPCAGPSRPQILWQYQIPLAGGIDPTVVAADGLVVFQTFGTQAQIWGLNATNGALVFNSYPEGTPSTSDLLATPAIYNHIIYTDNTLTHVLAFAENGMVISRSAACTGGNLNSIVVAQGGMVDVKLRLLYPYNLTMFFGPCVATQMQSSAAFSNGEFFLYGPSFAVTSTAFNLNAFTLTPTAVQWTWNSAVPTTNTGIDNPPAAAGNMVVVSGGEDLYAYSQGGTLLWSKALSTDIHGDVAIYNNTIYVQTVNNIYAFNNSGSQLWSAPTPVNVLVNTTPIITPSTLYVLANGLTLMGINAKTGNVMWSTGPYAQAGVSRRYVSEPALAYGNLYYPTANILVAVGSTCKADPSASILQDLATMYLNGEGSCATAMLDQLYPSSHMAIYINKTFAPALRVEYNPVNPATSNALIMGNSNPVLPTGNQITISAWVYPYSPQTSSPLLNGIVGYGSRSCNTGSTAILAMQSTGLPSFSDWCNYFYPSSGPIANFNRWNFIAAVLSGNYVTLYVNGNSVGGYLSNSSITVNVKSTNFYIGVLGAPSGNTYRPFNGLISNVQIYGNSLTTTQMTQLYLEGLAGAPLTNTTADPVSWLPMEGDLNDYGPANNYNNMRWFSPPLVPTFISSNYTPVTLLNSYQVSRAGVPMSIKVNGVYHTYNVSVVVWR